jgi:hypothetical protein
VQVGLTQALGPIEVDATGITIVLGFLFALACNVSALISGNGKFSTLHNTASLLGALGLLSILIIPITLLYALTDYFTSADKSYRGSVILGMVALASAISIASLVVSVLIRRRVNGA